MEKHVCQECGNADPMESHLARSHQLVFFFSPIPKFPVPLFLNSQNTPADTPNTAWIPYAFPKKNGKKESAWCHAFFLRSNFNARDFNRREVFKVFGHNSGP